MGRNGKHPHGCGEDLRRDFHGHYHQETPPRVWGRQQLSENQQKEVRNTPTGVGKTKLPMCIQFRLEKHPHGCGEDRPSPA